MIESRLRIQHLLVACAFAATDALINTLAPANARHGSFVRSEHHTDSPPRLVELSEVSVHQHGRFVAAGSRSSPSEVAPLWLPKSGAHNTTLEVANKTLEADDKYEMPHVDIIPKPPPLYYCRDGLEGGCLSFSFGEANYKPPDYETDSFFDAQMSCSVRPSNVGLSDSEKRASFGIGACPQDPRDFKDPLEGTNPNDPMSIEKAYAAAEKGNSLIGMQAGNTKQYMRYHTPPAGNFSPVVMQPDTSPTDAPPVLYFCRKGVDGPCVEFSYGEGQFIADNYPSNTLDNARKCCSLETDNQALKEEQMAKQFGVGPCPNFNEDEHRGGLDDDVVTTTQPPDPEDDDPEDPEDAEPEVLPASDASSGD